MVSACSSAAQRWDSRPTTTIMAETVLLILVRLLLILQQTEARVNPDKQVKILLPQAVLLRLA